MINLLSVIHTIYSIMQTKIQGPYILVCIILYMVCMTDNKLIMTVWKADICPCYYVAGFHFFSYWLYNPLWICILQPSSGAIASSLTSFLDHTHRRATVGRTPLDEWSVLRRDLYLTIHNTYSRQTSIPRWDSNPLSQQASGCRPTP